MEFAYLIVFKTEEGKEIERTGTGVFYPTDMKDAFKIEDVLWEMAERYGRPYDVEVHMAFKSGEIEDGTCTTKRIEASKAE